MTDSRAGEGKVEDAPGRHKQKSKNMLKRHFKRRHKPAWNGCHLPTGENLSTRIIIVMNYNPLNEKKSSYGYKLIN